ncbi:VOC family protein [Massilia solisilvae]|uniref:VOC family protein n=1 Tax=Massilia solisilvae TaxID=1811225 RepID=A0ABT2BH13_9BURK|nr:VOC family protein [Massilia solisilvae]MCS0607726.1 VOC family protein [Massilia solisilvae]
MPTISRITPCLWFDTQGEEAARFYTSVFPNSRITSMTHYPAVGQELHGRAAGSAMTVAFELDGQQFTALNGGPAFKFTEAVSMMVCCDNQDEVDHYWQRLGEGGEERECGWLKDRYGLFWQIVPRVLMDTLVEANPARVERVFAAMLKMRKMDVAELRRALAG